MIDIATERLLRLGAVPAFLAARGVRVSRRAVYDWKESGALETVRVGGILHTSEEALQRHADRGNGERAEMPADVRRRSEEAGRRLERMGW